MRPPPERLGSFYLGAEFDLETGKIIDKTLNYDAPDLTTHAVCVGMTGSGKTGLCIGLLEEAALDGVPAILIDPKGDVTNLMLQFPELEAEDFLPWINLDDARRKNKTAEEYAEFVADLWRRGLGQWGIGPERIRMLKASVEFTVYTPGSDAGIPVNILNSLAAPDVDFDEEAEAIRERINGTVAAILGLADVDVDPIRSREAVLLASIFEHYWRQNEDLDLEKLISSIQKPPFRRLGVFDVDSFYPEKDRFELAMAFNILVASPSFQGWLKGDPLEVDRLLYTEGGKPRHSIFYIAHLSEKERMFFVTLLLENFITWVRKQSGTTSLRALLYFDEVFGYMPPVAEPPSKRPLLTLMKQARAFGAGMVLVTQNPVDLDYKGLTNAGTWFIGKLQTERDKDRVLQGLKGAIAEAGGNIERVDYSEIIGRLSSRVFLMHNVHEDRPIVFHTRWVMSYLRGPLTRPQVRQLMAVRKETLAMKPSQEKKIPVSTIQPIAASEVSEFSENKPVLDPSVTQIFIPIETDEQEAIRQLTDREGTEINVENIWLVYEPKILGSASINFYDRKLEIDEKFEKNMLAPIPDIVGDKVWDDAEELHTDINLLRNSPEQVNPEMGPLYAPASQHFNDDREVRKIGTDLSDWLYYNERLMVKTHQDLEIFQLPGEDDRQFIIRLNQAARERRDDEVGKLEEKYESRLDKLENKIRKLEHDLAQDEMEYEARKREEMVGVGETVLSFFMGRRRTSAATTIARRRRMTTKVKMEIEETKEEIDEIKEDIEKLENELKNQVDEIINKWEKAQDYLTTKEIKPRRKDIRIRLVALTWIPIWFIKHRAGKFQKISKIIAY